jgi:hypothetical protein
LKYLTNATEAKSGSAASYGVGRFASSNRLYLKSQILRCSNITHSNFTNQELQLKLWRPTSLGRRLFKKEGEWNDNAATVGSPIHFDQESEIYAEGDECSAIPQSACSQPWVLCWLTPAWLD